MECFHDLNSAAGISRRHFSGAADDGTWDLGAGDSMRAMPGTNACKIDWFISFPWAGALTALNPCLLNTNPGDEGTAGVIVTAPCRIFKKTCEHLLALFIERRVNRY